MQAVPDGPGPVQDAYQQGDFFVVWQPIYGEGRHRQPHWVAPCSYPLLPSHFPSPFPLPLPTASITVAICLQDTVRAGAVLGFAVS